MRVFYCLLCFLKVFSWDFFHQLLFSSTMRKILMVFFEFFLILCFLCFYVFSMRLLLKFTSKSIGMNLWVKSRFIILSVWVYVVCFLWNVDVQFSVGSPHHFSVKTPTDALCIWRLCDEFHCNWCKTHNRIEYKPHIHFEFYVMHWNCIDSKIWKRLTWIYYFSMFFFSKFC